MPTHGLHPIPRAPIPPHVAARDSARDDQPLIQAWAGQTNIPPGATSQVLQMDLQPYMREWTLVLRVANGPVRLTTTAQYDGGRVQVEHVTILGAGGGWTLPPGAAFVCMGTSLSTRAVNVTWAMLEHGMPGHHAPYDFPVVGLTEGGAGAPGNWVDGSDIGGLGAIGLGWAPPDRNQVCLIPDGALDYRLVDETGLVVWSQFQTAVPVNMKHPGRARLQVRHPGAAVAIRSSMMCWNRS